MSQIFSIALNPEYPLIAAGTKYGQVHFFDVRDNQTIASFSTHNDSLSQIDFDPLYPVVVTAGYDDCVRLWDMRTRSCLYQQTVGLIGLYEVELVQFTVR